MKFEYNKHYATMALYLFCALSGTILFGFLLFNYRGVINLLTTGIQVLSPFIFGFGIAYILNAIMKWEERVIFGKLLKGKLSPKLTRVLSIVLVFLLLVAVLVLCSLFIIPQLVNSLSTLFNNLSSYAQIAQNFIYEHLEHLYAGGFITQEQVNKVTVDVAKWISESTDMLFNIIPIVVDSLKNITLGLANTFLAFVISIYFLARKEQFCALCKKILYAFSSDKTANRVLRVMDKADQTFGGFIIGRALDSTIVGVMCFVMMNVFQMQFAPLVSTMIGIANMIPYVGSLIGMIPSVAILLIVDPMKAIVFVIAMTLLMNFDGNVIVPYIMSSRVGLPGFWVLFAIIVGGGLFGILGMFVAVPTFAVIYAFTKEFVEERLERKRLPSSTYAYIKEEEDII